jgi:hypothetical protein
MVCEGVSEARGGMRVRGSAMEASRKQSPVSGSSLPHAGRRTRRLKQMIISEMNRELGIKNPRLSDRRQRIIYYYRFFWYF